MDLGGELGCEARLADARLPDQEYEVGPTLRGLLPAPPQLLQAAVAPDEPSLAGPRRDGERRHVHRRTASAVAAVACRRRPRPRRPSEARPRGRPGGEARSLGPDPRRS